MSTSRPTSVLIFLGACLAFSEALAGIAGKLDSKLSGIWILAFGSLNLVLVLSSLLYMFWKKPEFLIAERGDLVPLAIMTAIGKDNPKLMQEIIRKLNWESLSRGSARLPTIDPAESRPADADRKKLEEEQAKLKKKAGGS